jgi:hypothetical protein
MDDSNLMPPETDMDLLILQTCCYHAKKINTPDFAVIMKFLKLLYDIQHGSVLEPVQDYIVNNLNKFITLNIDDFMEQVKETFQKYE